MSIRSTLFTTAFLIATLGTAHAESLRPIHAKSIDLGDVSCIGSNRDPRLSAWHVRSAFQSFRDQIDAHPACL